MNLWERIQYDWNRGSLIIRLIFINVAVFILVNVLFGLLDVLFQTHIQSFVFKWFSLPSDLHELLKKPWTILTYGFLHKGVWHILFNMLWIYWIGSILVDFLGSRKLLPLYIYGILVGGLAYLLMLNLQQEYNHILFGASAGVMAIVWATVALLPDYKIHLLFFGSVPLVYLAAAFTIFDILSISGGTNAGGAIAHIGGALFGFSYIKLYQKGVDLSIGFNQVYDYFADLISKNRLKENVHLSYRKTSKVKPNQSKPSVKLDDDQEEQLNHILDKINESGYESLSKQEKEFLFKKSE